MRWLNTFTPQAGTLCHSKAVLFVDDSQSQRSKIYSIFNHGMGTYQDVYISGQESRKNSFPFLAFYRACQQLHPYIHPKQQFSDGIVMLVSQNFGRCHHASLKSIIQCHQHAHQCHQCFSTSNISLQ